MQFLSAPSSASFSTRRLTFLSLIFFFFFFLPQLFGTSFSHLHQGKTLSFGEEEEEEEELQKRIPAETPALPSDDLLCCCSGRSQEMGEESSNIGGGGGDYPRNEMNFLYIKEISKEKFIAEIRRFMEPETSGLPMGTYSHVTNAIHTYYGIAVTDTKLYLSIHDYFVFSKMDKDDYLDDEKLYSKTLPKLGMSISGLNAVDFIHTNNNALSCWMNALVFLLSIFIIVYKPRLSIKWINKLGRLLAVMMMAQALYGIIPTSVSSQDL
ncbi:uncharacterized protein LOC124933735 [Impatiens glandulifera]|uniref:uncharacterized protein LOC124933735 n=1 Tax=Impatiens glandulifera TaxID=253017 RepID=UPI001FB13D57|nr:uncharacterized protein LOC124933735 [Impatiens glandulifera]